MGIEIKIPWNTVARALALALCWAAVGAAEPDPDDKNDDERSGQAEESSYEEAVVVTASRTEQPLHEAPSSVTVVDAEQIATAPADDYGDLLRNVPGLNVVQFSAAEIQFNTRQAGGNLAQGQQILVDNRSVLYDFNGIMTLPGLSLNPSDIERIEAVRGPGGAVWGAGATNGVVNIITKRPKDMLGTRLTLGGGELGTSYGNLTHAGASGDLSWRVSGTWYEQSDPYERPTGTIPSTGGPGNPSGTPYPSFPNEGTTQPKLDLRVDYDLAGGSTLSVTGGFARFSGIPYTPIGPYSWDDDSSSWHGKVEWTRGGLQVRAHVTGLDVDGEYLLIRDPGGNLVRASFGQEAYHVEAVDTRLIGSRHLLTYGGNVRTSSYDVEIAPEGKSRDEIGAFLQDDIRLSEKWRFVVGGRIDDIETMGTAFSPRTTLMFEPAPGHSLRASWNRAFRAPTIVQTYIDLFSAYDVTLPDGQGGTVDLVFPLPSTINTDLEEERLDAFEIGWVGNVSERTTVTASLYYDDIRDVIRFVPASFYTADNPPPGWPLPPDLLDVPPPNGFAGLFPATLQYQNVGRIENRGVEASVEFRPVTAWRIWANASWQDQPETDGIEPVPRPDGTFVVPINLPPSWRANAGVGWSVARWWVDFSSSYQDEAFWSDVFDTRSWGPTDSFVQFNLAAGARFLDGTMQIAVRAQNVTDERVQQHVWGDIIGRKVVGEVGFRF